MHLQIDKTWTLFLDRDGVINERLPGDYVKTPDGFKFIEGTLEALAIFNQIFGKIIVVSNQQGIGKGLMTLEQVDSIHDAMIHTVQRSGGRIDKVYVSPYLQAQHHFTRKPSVGMGIIAKKDFREISFRRSLMVGDSKSDMIFGKRLGMQTVFIGDQSSISSDFRIIDFCFPNLIKFAKFLLE